MRNLTAGVVTATEAGVVRPRILAWFDFPSGEVRVWNGRGDLSWDSKTWTGVGTLGFVNPAQGGKEISNRSVEFVLSGFSSSVISAGLAGDYQNQDCAYWVAFMDSAGAIIGTPYEWYGRMDTFDIKDDGPTGSISLKAVSWLNDLDRPRERRYSNEAQQALFPGDNFCEWTNVIPDLDLSSWAQAGAKPTVPHAPVPPKFSA